MNQEAYLVSISHAAYEPIIEHAPPFRHALGARLPFNLMCALAARLSGLTPATRFWLD
jgi:hypothetical protein